ncbi:MAG: 16S rRNA (cytidine(1402)-2'-O)-methyltransferase [Fibrobacterota bacterium]
MGPLYIVSTPIGNSEDISLRALRILSEADLIAAEDTRHTRKLLSMHNIKAGKTISYHDHNKDSRSLQIIDKLKNNEISSAALVSDAGTPGIADPAYRIVRAFLDEGGEVIPVPGASAFLAALVASGLPADRFVFENFAPVKSGKRKTWLESLQGEKRTVIFYESPHRILKTLAAMREVLGNINIVVAREITKLHEEFLRGFISDLHEGLSKGKIRGEFAVMFNLRTAERRND